MIKFSCSDPWFYSLCALSVVLLAMGSNFPFMLFYYILLLRSVMAIAFHTEKLKALSTHVSHILALLVFHVPVLGFSIMHRFARHSSSLIHVIMSSVYNLFPPLMKPVIYSGGPQPFGH